jgi:nitrogen fixation/metabolism regulation signal transduction histidine kinase
MESWLESFARANFRRSADTAHDLKTPLNVAVLNLELLRMRLRKLGNADDEKIVGCMHSIEMELRRMGHIFDAFFLLSTPPRDDAAPTPIDLASVFADAASTAGLFLAASDAAIIEAHETRIREAARLFFEGTAKLFGADRSVAATRDDRSYVVSVAGKPLVSDFEPTKIFKFYYTDPDGNADLSLAVARLIAETYGGELNATDERDKVSIGLTFPLGAR